MNKHLKMVKVPYVNLAQQWSEEREELMPVIEQVLASGIYIGGENVDLFESNITKKLGVNHCVALNSGTDALVCALVSLGVRAGDEVITPPNSFIASTAAICHIGAVPVFADVLPDQTIDPTKIKEVITDRTKAIMPVHLTGRMAEMDKIMHIARQNNLVVIEDAAQSIGSQYNGQQSGTFGDVGCFSAHPLKNLNACGDAGFIVTQDQKIASTVRSMRNHGLVNRDRVENFGYVSRMDEIHAAILSYRLKHYDNIIITRRRNATIYKQIINEKVVFIPSSDTRYFDTFHTFVIQVNQRNKLRSFLDTRGVQTAIHYPIPIHLQPAAKEMGLGLGSFPETEKQSNRILTLPINQTLQTSQIEYVAKCVNEFYEQNND